MSRFKEPTTYSIITPRVAPVVCPAVIEAREAVRQAIQGGSVREINAAYARLEEADRAARLRRETALKGAQSRRDSNYAMRVATRLLGSPDPAKGGK